MLCYCIQQGLTYLHPLHRYYATNTSEKFEAHMLQHRDEFSSEKTGFVSRRDDPF